MIDRDEIKRMCAIHVIEYKEARHEELTEAEERFKRETEFTGIRLELLDEVPGMDSGRQSRVSLLSYQSDEGAGSVVWKRMGAGKGLSGEEATAMWKQLEPYRSRLLEAGWNVPALYYSSVVDVSNEESQIFSYEQFIQGGDAQVMLKDPEQPNQRKWFFVNEVMQTLFKYPESALTRQEVAGRVVSLLPDGLDMKAANFVLEEDTDQLYFVDLFGPKSLDSDREWQIYSPKIDTLPARNLKAVCATREGMILRFWRLTLALWASEDQERRNITREFLERLEAVDPPKDEFDLITSEIRSNCPWMDGLYMEHRI
jgi:hypothetical protein